MFFPTLGVIATTDVVTVDIHQTIQDALDLMCAHNHRSIIVVDQNTHDIITTKDIIRFTVEGIDFSTPLSHLTLRALPLIDKESNVINALSVTNEVDEYICVCNEDGSLYGLVTGTDIVASVDPQMILDSLPIATIFDHKYGFKSFEPEASMGSVLEYMKGAQSDCVIIQNDSLPVGILTTKDVLHFIGNPAFSTLKASDVMSAPIETLLSTASISEALDFLRFRNFKRIVVTGENGYVIGIVTQQDLISRTYLKWSQLVHEHFHQFEELTRILQQKNLHLTELATKDTLTGIHNRHMFTELFTKEQAFSKRHHVKLFLLMIDLDHFKQINDSYGHNVGDDVLKGFAQRVNASVRDVDSFARWGGEEFVLLLQDVSCEESYAISEKIRMLVESSRFDEVGEMTCSIGIAEVKNTDTLNDAIDRADGALYRAKKEGRNRTVACSE